MPVSQESRDWRNIKRRDGFCCRMKSGFFILTLFFSSFSFLCFINENSLLQTSEGDTEIITVEKYLLFINIKATRSDQKAIGKFIRHVARIFSKSLENRKSLIEWHFKGPFMPLNVLVNQSCRITARIYSLSNYIRCPIKPSVAARKSCDHGETRLTDNARGY